MIMQFILPWESLGGNQRKIQRQSDQEDGADMHCYVYQTHKPA